MICNSGELILNILLSRVKTLGITLVAIVWASVAPVAAIAAGSGNHEHTEASEPSGEGSSEHHNHKLDSGEAGKAGEVTRTIEIIMGDIYFKPVFIQANKGDTVRFSIKNEGALVHEFNIGTLHMHQEHQMEMAKMMQMGMMTATTLNHEKMNHGGMKHDDANSVLLEPGKSAELIWKFTQPRKLEFACNVPGHYEAGMVGSISIEEPVSKAFTSGSKSI
jgi:uncharacterized cupredoxin-like copper-binding protein